MCPSAHLCAYNNLKTIEWMYNKFDTGELFEKLSGHWDFHVKWTVLNNRFKYGPSSLAVCICIHICALYTCAIPVILLVGYMETTDCLADQICTGAKTPY